MPARPFTHFLLTRFNLRRSFGGGVPPGEAWLEDRFRLFEAFCLPSVARQTARDFRWLVFFDAGTPVRFRSRVDALALGGAFEPCFVAEGGGPEIEAVRERLEPGREWVLSTRLDNDDALHEGFLEAVQQAFLPQPEILNLPQGFVLDAARHRLYASRQPANPFGSRAEAAEDPWTVLHAGGHQTTREPVRQVETEPLWLQVVHGRNHSNRVTPHMERVPLASLDAGFHLKGYDTRAAESPLALRLENGVRRVSSVLRRATRRAGLAPARSKEAEVRPS